MLVTGYCAAWLVVIAFLSQKGGVSKSTLARLIAREYANAGWNVKIADLDVGQGTSFHWQGRRLQNQIQSVIPVERFGSIEQALRFTAALDLQVLYHRAMIDPNDLPKFDAGTYQKPLGALAEVLAQKLRREAPKLIQPPYAAIDMHVMLRVVMRAYDLLHYINADERREKDTDWRLTYSISTLPLVRNMIDCLYNITAILQDPRVNGPWYRKSGFRKAFIALEEDKERYGGQAKWDDWIDGSRRGLDFAMRDCGLTITEVMAEKPWPTLGKYLSDRQPGGGLTPHQQFLRTFTYGFWREYSAIAHSGFEGLLVVGMYYVPDSFMHDDREKLETQHIGVLSLHIPRAAIILLCIVTELQAYFRFDGADINKRIHAMWNALMPLFDAKELYDERYRQLMIDKGIKDW